MGRGRQKAKQTKVARALKYHTASIDVDALQRELSGTEDRPPVPERDDHVDPYAQYSADPDEDDDEPADGYAAHSHRR